MQKVQGDMTLKAVELKAAQVAKHQAEEQVKDLQKRYLALQSNVGLPELSQQVGANSFHSLSGSSMHARFLIKCA